MSSKRFKSASISWSIMADYQQIYRQKTTKSRTLYQRAQAVIPGGICHNLRYHPPHPVYISRAQGSRFWDVDGNEYLDFWMGHYTHILGHSPPQIVSRVKELLAEGVMHSGVVNPLEVELAELVCELVPSAQRVRFCCSGTEATMYAVRLARAYTGRSKIIKVQGGWHGAGSDLLAGVCKPYDKPDSLGLLKETAEAVVTIPFNDPRVAAIIREQGPELAGVILEPIVGVGGFIAATPDFLSTVRRETQAVGAVLIYDEIISGFRVALGGAQELLGVEPDLTVLGKILGGGWPIGAVAGQARIMDLCNPQSHPDKWERALVGGGTFSCLPASMAAGICMLRLLKQQARQLYPRLAEVGENLRSRIEQVFARHGVYAKCTGVGSLFMTHFPESEGVKLDSPYAVNYLTDVDKREIELKARLLSKGIYVMHGGGAVSSRHSRADIDFFIAKLAEVAGEMR
jgi:glutamate-1-semialdehyde 2,1-aminomutase